MADDRRGRILQFARDFLKANLLEGDSEIGEMLELEPLPKAAEIDAAFAPAPPVDFDAQRREDEAFGRDVIAKLDRIPSPLLRHLVALAVELFERLRKRAVLQVRALVLRSRIPRRRATILQRRALHAARVQGVPGRLGRRTVSHQSL